jgi:hypothetical protein
LYGRERTILKPETKTERQLITMARAGAAQTVPGLELGSLPAGKVFVGLGRIAALYHQLIRFVTEFTIIFGASVSEGTMRPNPKVFGTASTWSSPRPAEALGGSSRGR